ncbi:arabinoxylan arabinofuranohydrolase [Hordeum vulgare]|nr:arabinoxylan arabinofuranohydrolase [Hordeum vulgare]
MNEMAGISSSEFPLGHVQLYRWLLIDVVHWLVVDVNQLIDCLSLCRGKVAYRQFLGLCVYLYDVHVYASSANMFSRTSMFDNTPRSGPKAIVSEYAVTGNDAGKGTLVAALAEAAFLVGLEKNSDVVEMASCAPLFVNENDHKERFNILNKKHCFRFWWSPDAIVLNSWKHYGCPNYWMLHFCGELRQKTRGSQHNGHRTGSSIKSSGSKKTVLTSTTPLSENSFQQHEKVVPVSSPVADAKEQMGVVSIEDWTGILSLISGKSDTSASRSASLSEQVTDCVNVVGLTILAIDMPQLPPEAMTDLWWDGSGTTMEILSGDRVIVLLWEHDYLK